MTSADKQSIGGISYYMYSSKIFYLVLKDLQTFNVQSFIIHCIQFHSILYIQHTGTLFQQAYNAQEMKVKLYGHI